LAGELDRLIDDLDRDLPSQLVDVFLKAPGLFFLQQFFFDFDLGVSEGLGP
jgi:hypothetical protein